MALPSQSPRPGMAGPRFSGGRRSRRSAGIKRILGLLILVITAGTIYVVSNTSKPTEAAASNETASVTQEPNPTPTNTLPRVSARNASTDPEPTRTTLPPVVMTTAQPLEVAPAHTTRQDLEKTPEARQGSPVTRITTTPEPQPRSDSSITLLINRGERLYTEGQPLDARDVLNRALHDNSANDAERARAMSLLSSIANDITFSATIIGDDPTVQKYTVVPRDSLTKILRTLNAKVEPGLITSINNLSNPNRIRVGQSLKIINGPLHAVVHKDAYRFDLYADQTDSSGNRIYLRSFPVGLGEFDSTPTGAFVVRTNSKLEDPRWVNPRTGEVFEPNNPDNPIGERWIGLLGTDPQTELLAGYGIHGTIEPKSIGTDASMGCVRMLDNHINFVYDALVQEHSTVMITD
ncbi:MAG: L,D-transpeptidase family protein [Planctomycetota bacterium]